jgi:hypothetical protein
MCRVETTAKTMVSEKKGFSGPESPENHDREFFIFRAATSPEMMRLLTRVAIGRFSTMAASPGPKVQ